MVSKFKYKNFKIIYNKEDKNTLEKVEVYDKNKNKINALNFFKEVISENNLNISLTYSNGSSAANTRFIGKKLKKFFEDSHFNRLESPDKYSDKNNRLKNSDAIWLCIGSLSLKYNKEFFTIDEIIIEFCKMFENFNFKLTTISSQIQNHIVANKKANPNKLRYLIQDPKTRMYKIYSSLDEPKTHISKKSKINEKNNRTKPLKEDIPEEYIELYDKIIKYRNYKEQLNTQKYNFIEYLNDVLGDKVLEKFEINSKTKNQIDEFIKRIKLINS